LKICLKTFVLSQAYYSFEIKFFFKNHWNYH